MEEKWLEINYIDPITNEINDYSDRYVVSNFGNVKSLNYRHTGKERMLKQAMDKDGYMFVVLKKNGKAKKIYVHRLVALMFVEQTTRDRVYIDHINCIRNDNRSCNLRWCMQKENLNINEKSKELHRKTVIKNSPIKPTPVEVINREGVVVGSFPTISEAVKWLEKNDVKANSSSISRCCRGGQKSAYGYKWRYKLS